MPVPPLPVPLSAGRGALVTATTPLARRGVCKPDGKTRPAPSDHAMESNTNFTESDEGKNVINQNGETIGRVVEVEGNRAYVDPDPGVTDTIMSKLGWGSRDEGSYLLESGKVESITDDEVRLGSL